jgi:hypothetical protein
LDREPLQEVALTESDERMRSNPSIRRKKMSTPNEIEIMRAALPIVEAVPAAQDSCWPGDGPAHDDDCNLVDHAASASAVSATEGLSWEFTSWSEAAAWFCAELAVDVRIDLQKLAAELDHLPAEPCNPNTPEGERQCFARGAKSLLADEKAGFALDMRESRYLLDRAAGRIVPVASDEAGDFAL